MPGLEMDPLAQFQQLLQNMMSPENETRSLAEENYEKLPIAERATACFQLYKITNVNLEIRSMALVLLRRLLVGEWETIWGQWSVETQNHFKIDLLQLAASETDQTLRKRLADIISEISRNSLDGESGEQKWPEVLHFLSVCASATEWHRKELALLVFENVPGIFGVTQEQCLPAIYELLKTCMLFDGPNGAEVRTAAARALSSFLCDNDEDAHTLRNFSGLIQILLKVCESSVMSSRDEADDIPLQCLGDLATSTPKLLRQQLTHICELCIKTVSNKELDDCFRHSALEVLVSLCESAPGMMRKQGKDYIPAIVQQCLSLMVELEDDDDWATNDSTIEEDDDDNATVGETSLDRVAISLGGKSVLPTTIDTVPKMLQNTDWKYRHAALMAISTVGEGCKKGMEPLIESLINSMLPYLGDPHERIRYAVCNAFGQMSTDFAPTLQKKCHAKMIPAILTTVQDLSSPRVAAHAGAALVNFSEECPKHILTPYLDTIMEKLEWVLEHTFKAFVDTGKKLVLEQIITTIASVADTSEDKFVNYYDRVMPCLKYILKNATSSEHRLLRGKTIECISLIGLAVGTEKFSADAHEIMEVLLQSQTEMGEMEADDPQISYMMSAWARICKLMGAEFARFLPLVMPAVLRVASFKPEVAVFDDDEAQNVADDVDWQLVQLGDQQAFGIRTAGLEDKATACEMLVCYARELKEAFVDYVEEVTRLMIPHLKFYFHDGVRGTASEIMPLLLKCGAAKGVDYVREMWTHVYPPLLEAIGNEHEPDVAGEHLHGLANCIEYLGEGCLTHEQLQLMTNVINKLFETHFKKEEEKNEKRHDEDHDEEQEKELIEEIEIESAVIARISDVWHAFFSTHKENTIPFFEQILPNLARMLEPGRPYVDRQWALCIFDDLIEFGGPNSIKYQQYFLRPGLLAGLADEAAEVRQAAAYGFGVMAMHGGNAYAQTCSEAIPVLGVMISAPEARTTSENTSATENAISAVAKILKYNSSMVDINAVLPTFLEWLPCWEDDEEMPHIYGYFCDLVESNNAVALGPDNSNLPRLMTIVAEAFVKEAFSDECCAEVALRIKNIVRQIQTNNDMFQACVQTLNQEQQLALHKALSV